MNKKLLVLALAGAFAAPAAMADVTISGTINTGPVIGTSGNATSGTAGNGVANVAGANVAGGQGFTTMGLTSNYSNININSTEDIGDGNKVVFNYSLDVSNTGSTVHDTAGALRSRNSFIGFEGNWGSLRMGINEHIYERYMYQSDTLDGAAGIGGNLQMLGTAGYGNVFQNGNSTCGPSSGCQGFYRRSGNSVWYDSPDINGFTFGIAQTLNAYQTANNGIKPTATSMGAQYKPADMPFFVNIAYERHKDFFGLNGITGVAGATGSTDTGLQIGGGVTLGDLNIYARYEQLKYKSNGLTAQVNEYKRNATWLGLKYNLTTGYATVQVGMASDGSVSCGTGFTGACNANESGAFMLNGGYAHNLSKQTQLLFIGSYTNNDALASYVNIGSPSAGRGADGRSFAVLVKHSF